MEETSDMAALIIMLERIGYKHTIENAGQKMCIMLDGDKGGVADFTFDESGTLIKVIVAKE